VEREFDGRAKSTTYTATDSYDIAAPDLTGDTGIGEIGVRFTLGTELPLSIDMGLQGYTGKREGITGAVQLKLTF
jgi:hypothetical protein